MNRYQSKKERKTGKKTKVATVLVVTAYDVPARLRMLIFDDLVTC